MGDDREEIARIIDHEGYWERLDSCNHALATVSMTDDQRRALTAVRDDELRGTASSLAKADAILARQGPGPGEAVAWNPGDRVIYTMDDDDDKWTLHATIVRPVEGWWEVRFRDDSTAIVRPSRLAATPTREA